MISFHLTLCNSRLQYLKVGVFGFVHLQESRDKYVFIGSQQLPSCDEINMHVQGEYSHGTWSGQFKLGWEGQSWDGVCSFCTAMALSTNTLCPKKVPKGGRRKRRTAPFILHKSGKQWLPSFTLTLANPSMASFPPSSTSSHRNGFIC